MMSKDERTQAVMNRLLTVMPPIMREIGFSQRTCILQTRIATVVLGELGFRVRPLACTLVAGNAAWAKLMDELGRMPTAEEWSDRDDVWCLGITPDGCDGPGYNGHVIAVVEERYGLDLTIDQADRPKYGMRFTPHHFAASPAFLAGDEPAVFTHEGSWVRYEAMPGEKGFLRAADWTEPVKTGGRAARVNPLPRVREAMQARMAA